MYKTYFLIMTHFHTYMYMQWKEVDTVISAKSQHVLELQRQLESLNEELILEKQNMLSVQKVSIAITLLYTT